MSVVAKIENLEEFIIEIKGQKVFLDADVAAIYGVETKRVNEAVKNNPDKFPQDYMLVLSGVEFANFVVENFDAQNLQRQELHLKPCT